MNTTDIFAPVASKEGSYASAAKPMRFPTGAFPFARATQPCHPSAGRGQPGELGSTPSARSKITQTPRGTAARPNVGRNDIGYNLHGGSPLAGVAGSFAGRGRLQLATFVEKPARTVTFAGAAAKPDSSLPMISPKCCPPLSLSSPVPYPICNLTSYTYPRQSESRRVEPDEIYGVATQLPKATRHQKQSDDRQLIPAGVNPQLASNPVTAESHPHAPCLCCVSGLSVGVASKG